MEKSQVQKPMIIAIEEAEPILVNAVNQILQSGVSPYFANIIFEKVHAQVRNLAQNEMEQTQMQYASALENAKNEGEAPPQQDDIAK